MINWINQKLNINLDPNGLESIKDFSLIWNIFERIVCGMRFTINTAEVSLNQNQFQQAEFQACYDYFRNRYTGDAVALNRFDHLNFRPNDRRAYVRQVLEDPASSIADIVLALTIIVYRLRNNLFHGEKDMRFIEGQVDNFEQANAFLKTLLNYYP
ncbi:hypothetical protein [Mucilaginibacter sp. NFR10]|uniref:hypothetical protein n=1 Tax=Mucilaginibacter sp. NFR10 TaxID=1566292 RepID=UPI000871A681|nr:hypothetical protein [Mucilaginibacter sp. NFR10]SCW71995.1 hypothetical protein SAMN03159284_03464 [Mucilaginibacter sp. NFR10]